MGALKVAIDSNVLFRTLISGGKILELFFNSNLKLLAPLRLKEEFSNNESEIISKSKLPRDTLNSLVILLFKRIEFVPFEEYSSFIPEAKKLLGKHEKDEDFVALCLSKNLKLWTYELLLFEIGVGISTKEISERLDEL